MKKLSITKASLEQYCIDLGARRTGSRWVWAAQDTLAVLELQRSQYGPTDYLNVGWFLRDLGEEAVPSFFTCHIKARFDSYLPAEARESWRRLTDLETPIADAERAAGIGDCLGTYLTPILRAAATLTVWALRSVRGCARMRCGSTHEQII